MRTRLDAVALLFVTGSLPSRLSQTKRMPQVIRLKDQRKKRLFRAAHKEAREGRKFSGKAMQDEFEACARTLVMEKSKI